MAQGVAHLMNDAALYIRTWEDGLDRVGEALQVVGAGDQDILHPALLQITQHAQPVACPFGLRHVHAQHVLVAVLIHAQHRVHRAVVHRPFVLDLEEGRVHPYDCIHRFQRTCLPGAQVLDHRVGHRIDHRVIGLHSVDLPDVRTDVRIAQPKAIEAQDLLVQFIVQHAHALANQLGLEGP